MVVWAADGKTDLNLGHLIGALNVGATATERPIKWNKFVVTQHILDKIENLKRHDSSGGNFLQDGRLVEMYYMNLWKKAPTNWFFRKQKWTNYISLSSCIIFMRDCVCNFVRLLQ